MKRIACVCLALFLALAIGSVQAATVMVFAAASLTDSLKEIAGAYEKESGDKIVFNFAASGPLARQIQEGAPADIFFSADEARADALEQKGLLVKGSRVSRLGNSLVIIEASDSKVAITSAQALTNAEHVALGDLKTVPVGTYSKAYLDSLNLWAAIEPKVVPCESVRAVLAAVEAGNVEAGIVYKTDAGISKKVKIVYEVPASAGPKITYPVALVKDGPQAEAARKFLKYLSARAASDIFTKYGFVNLP